MAGHNGGFNPYRDQNGEFADPATSGKPGRSRKGGSGPRAGTVSGSRTAPAAPKVVAGKWNTKTRRDNPHAETQFWSDNTGHREGLKNQLVSYRGKGQNIYGAKATPRTKTNPALNPGAKAITGGWTGGNAGATQLAKPARAPKGQAKTPTKAPTTRAELIQNFKHPTTKAAAVKAARLFLGDTTSTPEQLYEKLGAWEDARIKAGRKNDKEEQVMAGISQTLANTLF